MTPTKLAVIGAALLAAAAAARAAAAAPVAIEVRHKNEFAALRSDFDCGISVPEGGGVGGVRGLPTCNVRGISFSGAERVVGAGAGANAEPQPHVLAELGGTAACAVATNAAAYVCDGAATSVWAADTTSQERAQLAVTTLCGVSSMALRVAVTAPAGAAVDAAEQLQVGVTVGDAPEHVVLLPAGKRAATLLVSSAAAFEQVRLRAAGAAGDAGAGVCVSHIAVPCCAECGGQEQQYATDDGDDDALPPLGGCCVQPYAAGNPTTCAPRCAGDTLPLPDAPTTCRDCAASAQRRPRCTTNFDACDATTRSGCACAACQNKALDDCHVIDGGMVAPSGAFTPSDAGGKRCLIVSSATFNGTHFADFDCVIVRDSTLEPGSGQSYAIDLRDAAPGACVVLFQATVNGRVGRTVATTVGDYYAFDGVSVDDVEAGDGPDVVLLTDTIVTTNVHLGGGDDFLQAITLSVGNLVLGENGNDIIEMSQSRALAVHAGDGNDSIMLVDVMLAVAVDLVAGDNCVIAEGDIETSFTDGSGTDACVSFNPDESCSFTNGAPCERRLCESSTLTACG